jgi:hypothetical protein
LITIQARNAAAASPASEMATTAAGAEVAMPTIVSWATPMASGSSFEGAGGRVSVTALADGSVMILLYLPTPAISRSIARSARHGQIITVDSDADQNDFARKKTAHEWRGLFASGRRWIVKRACGLLTIHHDRSDAGRVARPASRWHVLGSQAPE